MKGMTMPDRVIEVHIHLHLQDTQPVSSVPTEPAVLQFAEPGELSVPVRRIVLDAPEISVTTPIQVVPPQTT
jgi:hypothetical protein